MLSVSAKNVLNVPTKEEKFEKEIFIIQSRNSFELSVGKIFSLSDRYSIQIYLIQRISNIEDREEKSPCFIEIRIA